MTDNEINTIKTDIAVIKRDITQISQVYKKVDDTLEQMSEMAKTLAVQEKTLENDARRISVLEENLVKHNQDEAEFRKELSKRLDDMVVKIETDREAKHRQTLDAIEKMSSSINNKLADQDKRISSLEGWRWYVAGIVAVIVIIVNKIPWSSLFGS
jgi:K+/H+ antiporter YhaU regulatory subunit KhtT